jgi:hypothetical protein
MRDREPLFGKFLICTMPLENHKRKLREYVDALPSGQMLGKSPAQLVDEAVAEHHVAVPVLRVDETTVDQGEVEVDVSRDTDRAGLLS